MKDNYEKMVERTWRWDPNIPLRKVKVKHQLVMIVGEIDMKKFIEEVLKQKNIVSIEEEQ